MAIYKLHQSLAVSPIVSKQLPGQLLVSFANGLLHSCSYRPVGLNSMWCLIGAAASAGPDFVFEIKLQPDRAGLLGAFVGNGFYLFDLQGDGIRLFTIGEIAVSGASRVVIEDQRYSTNYWVLESALVSFDELVLLGNTVLLSQENPTFTTVSQKHSSWIGEKYR